MGLEDSLTPEKSALLEVESYRRLQKLKLKQRPSLGSLRNESKLGEIVMPALPKSPPLGKYSRFMKKVYDVSDQKISSKCRGLVIPNNKSTYLFTILEPKIIKLNWKGRYSPNVSCKGGKKSKAIQVLKLRKKSKLSACKLLMKDSTSFTDKQNLENSSVKRKQFRVSEQSKNHKKLLNQITPNFLLKQNPIKFITDQIT